ncbi:MAG: class I SAM-dependent methyltransferase [Actinobacteria bacterium]|nr:class I SAM-dependent methyltransferase [Actinomycetota bacterium]
MERNDGLRRYLLRAPVYRAAQRAIGADKCSRRLAAEVIKSTPETHIVDIGCGTADIADYISFASYTGFDPNPPYVEQASTRLAERAGGRATIFEGRVGDPSLLDRLPKHVDIALMMGVLHHLDDALADEALQLASSLIGTTGRFISFDPGLVPGQPRIARALITRDRGQHVRTVEASERLLRRHFGQVTVDVHHDFLSVPYTHLVVEATNTA